jgi:serine/threonine protein kinase
VYGRGAFLTTKIIWINQQNMSTLFIFFPQPHRLRLMCTNLLRVKNCITLDMQTLSNTTATTLRVTNQSFRFLSWNWWNSRSKIVSHFGNVYVTVKLVSVLYSYKYTYTDRDVERWSYQCAAGVAHIHRLGLLHRDLKPDKLVSFSICQTYIITGFTENGWSRKCANFKLINMV